MDDIAIRDNLIGMWYVKLRAPHSAPSGVRCSWCALLYRERNGIRVRSIYEFWSKESGQQTRMQERTVRADRQKMIQRAHEVGEEMAGQAGTQLYEALRIEGQPFSDFRRACDVIRSASRGMH